MSNFYNIFPTIYVARQNDEVHACPNVTQTKKSLRLRGEFEEEILENTPNSGFIINERQSWIGRTPFVEIEDPRGFSFDVSLEELLKLIKEVSVVNGIIESECVWARHNRSYSLIPITSDFYKEANESNSLRKAKFLPDKKIIPGKTYITKDGIKETYIGKKVLTKIPAIKDIVYVHPYKTKYNTQSGNYYNTCIRKYIKEIDSLPINKKIDFDYVELNTPYKLREVSKLQENQFNIIVDRTTYYGLVPTTHGWTAVNEIETPLPEFFENFQMSNYANIQLNRNLDIMNAYKNFKIDGKIFVMEFDRK